MNASTCPSPCNESALSTFASITSLLTFFLGLTFSYIALLTSTRSAPGEIARLISDLRSTQSEINRVAEYIFYDYDVGLGAHQRHGDGFAGWQKVEKQGSRTGSGFSGETKTDGVVHSDVNGGMGNGGGGGGGGGDGGGEGDPLYNEVQTLLRECITLFYEADDLLKRTHVAGPQRSYSSYVIGRKGVEIQNPLGNPHAPHNSRSNTFLKNLFVRGYRWARSIVRRIRYLVKKDEVGEKMARLGEQKQKLGSVQMSLFLRKSAVQDAMLRTAVGGMERVLAREREREREREMRDDGDMRRHNHFS